MKKFLSYILFFLFIYSTIGYLPVFLLRQNSIRTEIKQQIKNAIPEKEFTVFSFSKEEYSNLKWEKKNKKLHYVNSMYDVIRKTINEDGNIHLYCINDFREKQLFVNLEKEVRKNSETSSTEKNMQNIFKLLSNSCPPCGWNKIFVSVSQSEKELPYIHSFFLSFIGKIPSPPPKFI